MFLDELFFGFDTAHKYQSLAVMMFDHGLAVLDLETCCGIT